MIYLLFFILIVVMQIKICKNYKNTKLGLILPIGSFLIAILSFISLLLSFILEIIDFFTKVSKPVKFDINFLSPILIQALNILILIIIIFMPTVIFLLIYKHYKKS
nr:hypothetical protein [uncultured Tyzzerella sp.]